MMALKFGKRIAVLVITLVVFAATLAIAYAASGDSDYWYDPDGSYSPQAGVASTSPFRSGWVYVEGRMERFYWTSARLNAIISYYENNGYYWTADMRNVYDNWLTAFGWYATNLPSPHYDIDDDPEPWGNGYFDEAEVTVEDPYALSAYTEYYFWNYWRDTSEGNASGRIMVTSQMSRWDWWMGEYNTVMYDDLLDWPGLYWSTYGLASLYTSSNTAYAQGPVEQQPADDNGDSTPGSKFPRTEEELEKYKQEALARQQELTTSEARGVEVPVMITFVESQPLTVVADLAGRYQMQTRRFDARGLSGTERITIGGIVDEEDKIDEAMLQKVIENINVDFIGIISLRGTIPVETLLSIQEDERVFLADVPLPAAFRSAQDEGLEIKPPPSVYWVVENIR